MVDINDLLKTAKEENSFDDLNTLDLVKSSGLQIGKNIGLTVDSFKSNEALLIWNIIDDSSSICDIPDGENSICKGQNIFMDEFKKHKDRKDILIGQSLLNLDTPIHPFIELPNAVRLERGKNYNACGYTPLYQRCCEVLGTMAVKSKVEFLDSGFPCRCILSIFTDGENYVPHNKHDKYTANNVKTLINELGESLIVYFVGIEGNSRVDFRKVASDMGIPDSNILTPDSTQDAIKEAFRRVSRSASSASKSTQSFSKAASSGGFID